MMSTVVVKVRINRWYGWWIVSHSVDTKALRLVVFAMVMGSMLVFAIG